MKISWRPRRFGGPAHRLRPRDDQRFDVRRHVASAHDAAAASSRSDRRPLVHEPMNATSIRVPSTRAPALEAHERQRFLVRRRSGIGSPMPTDCPGLMPQVTVGSIAPRRTTRGRRTARSRIRGDLAPPGDRAIERRPRRARTGGRAGYANVVSSGLT